MKAIIPYIGSPVQAAKSLLLAAKVLTLLTACSGDDVGGGAANRPVAAQIRAGVEASASRAVNNLWEADEIGVMVTEGSSEMRALYRNVKYTTTAEQEVSAAFTAAAGEIYFQGSSGEVRFAAYAPYQPSAANVLPGTDGVITDISTEKQSTREEQKAFDYIYASGATATMTAPEVKFQGDNAFTHRMARLIIIVKAGRGFDATEVMKGTYTLKGLKHSGTFNVTTGEAAATGEADAAAWSLDENSLLTAGETTQRTYTSILFPQDLSTAPLTFTADIGGQRYASSINPSLEAGTSHVYTVTLHNSGITVTAKITDWLPGNGDDGETGYAE